MLHQLRICQGYRANTKLELREIGSYLWGNWYTFSLPAMGHIFRRHNWGTTSRLPIFVLYRVNTYRTPIDFSMFETTRLGKLYKVMLPLMFF
jgi:hypothetical protein